MTGAPYIPCPLRAMPPPTRSADHFPGRIALCIVLSLLFASSSLAIDLGRAFGKKNKDGATGSSDLPLALTSEEALANAKKLVNDMNDAATGTVTSYQPGRERQPVTCNEIMAKSLVLSSEEKAAIVAEKDAVVRAAAMLSEKIDDLTEKLQLATDVIEDLERTLGNFETDEAARVQALKDEAARDMQEAERILSETKEDHGVEVKALKDEAARAMQEAERILSETNEDHRAEVQALKEDAELQRREWEKKLADTEANWQAKMQVAEDDAQGLVREAEQKVMDGIERSKVSMDALKNATAATVARVEGEAAGALAAKDADVAERLAESERHVAEVEADAADRIFAKEEEVQDKLNAAERRIADARSDAESAVALAEKDANDRVVLIKARAERERLATLDATQKQVEGARVAAEQTVNRIEMMMADKELEHGEEVAALKADHAEKVKGMEELVEIKFQEADFKIEQAIAEANDKVTSEREINRGLIEEFEKKRDDAKRSEGNVRDDLKLIRTMSIKLEQERSYWMEAHKSQGYCNVTLIKEDSRRLIGDVFDEISWGLESGLEALAVGLSAQVDFVQSKGADSLQFIKDEVVPTIQRIASEAHNEVVALYDAHLAEAVNNNLVPLYDEHVYPLYNQHILPVYTEHVSPVVKTIKSEAAVVIEKSQNEVQRARTGAAGLVRQASTSALDVIEEREIDGMLPGWLISLVTHSSRDGEWAVDASCKWVSLLAAILCRSLIMRIIGAIFSLGWYFCPLRLFVGGRRKTGEDGTDEASKRVTFSSNAMEEVEGNDGVQSETNGKVKMS